MMVTVLADYIDGTQSKNTDVELEEVDVRAMLWTLMTKKGLTSVTLVKHNPIEKYIKSTVHRE